VKFNPMDLTDRTILVTGASSGIGRETSILLSRLRARLILVARNTDQLRKTESELEGSSHSIETYDLSTVSEIPIWLKSLASEIGPLDGLVHCAGIQINEPIRYLKVEDVDKVMQINFASAIHLAKGFRQKKVCSSPSSVVFLSSVMGLVGQPGASIYAASKGALVALTKSLAMELASEGIRVNCVAPGCVQTRIFERLLEPIPADQVAAIKAMHPLGIGSPVDVANAIAFLVADTGRWITGSTLVVDGGYTAH